MKIKNMYIKIELAKREKLRYQVCVSTNVHRACARKRERVLIRLQLFQACAGQRINQFLRMTLQ